MQYRKCFSCGEDKPQNDILAINRELICADCVDKKVMSGESVDMNNAVFEFDSTVCSFCGHDAGELDLPLKASRPICDDCTNSIERKISPAWLSPFLFLIGFSIVGGIVFNWKYFEGYFILNKVVENYVLGDIESAYRETEQLIAKIPDSKDLKFVNNYYGGMYFLSVDSSKKALEMLNEIQEPDDFLVYLKNNARLSVAFDDKEYQTMLYYAEEIYKTDSSASALLSVASANACLYATTNDEKHRKLAETQLSEALLLDDSSKSLQHYASKIEHRIATKRILTEEQYVKEFPNDWKK